jgi:cyclophilin family peptidyl-prolyl cis-trans isomerase
MKHTNLALTICAAFALSTAATASDTRNPEPAPVEAVNAEAESTEPESAEALTPGLYATMSTSKGDIVIELYYKKVPLTVTNFVGLAEGKIKSIRPGDQPYYDGLIFHRVIADFMIQGGCPNGNGRGNPGYKFQDEFDPTLRHSGPGILSMANSGPGTNGSQFFITHKATPWLDDRHAVFGKVVNGQDVVDAIAKGDSLDKIVIKRVGADAEKFIANQAAFDKLLGGNQ